MIFFKLKPDLPTRIFNLSSVAFFALGLFGYALPAVGYFSAVPGDFGDDRFNSVILEHLFRWVSGRQVSLWSPAFFYPFEHVLAFSDNHFGASVFYILLRFSGLSREVSFDGWFLIGFILNYFCTCWAFRRIGFSQLACAAGAFVFCFSLPVFQTETHAQMCYRFAIPLAFVAFWSLLATKRLFLLWEVVFWSTIQFFCSIYLGVFLFYLLVATFIAWLIVEAKKQYFSDPLPGFQKEKRAATVFFYTTIILCMSMLVQALHKYYVLTLKHPFAIQYDSIYIVIFLFCLLSATFIIWLIVAEKQYFSDLLPGFQKEKRAAKVFFGFTTFTSISMLVWLLHNYYATMLEYDFQPGLFYLFSFSDYFLKDSIMFVGFGVWSLCVFGIVKTFQRGFEKKIGRIGLIAVISFVLLFVVTLYIKVYSLYGVIYLMIPGISAIRAVPRILLVMLLPMGILAAVSVEAVQRKAVDASMATKSLLLIALFFLLGAEVIAYHPKNTSIHQWQARKNALLEIFPAQLPAQPILYVTAKKGDPSYSTELDGMILAQDLGIPTLNGASGHEPPGYSLPEPCSSYRNRLLSYASFRKLPLSAIEHLAQRVFTVSPTPCPHDPVVGAFGNINPSQVKDVKIK